MPTLVHSRAPSLPSPRIAAVIAVALLLGLQGCTQPPDAKAPPGKELGQQPIEAQPKQPDQPDQPRKDPDPPPQPDRPPLPPPPT